MVKGGKGDAKATRVAAKYRVAVGNPDMILLLPILVSAARAPN
jgi:hypothetical protein